MNLDSALLLRETPARVKAAVSALLALLLVIAGAITAPTAFAAGQALSAPVVPRAGGTISVTGTGYSTTSPGIYLGLRAEGATSDTFTVWIDVENTIGDLPGLGATAPMNEDGSFTVSIPVPAYTEGVSYTLFSRKAHGIPDPSQNLTQPLVYEAAPATATSTALSASPEGTAVEGADVTLSAIVTPAADGSVVFRSGGADLGTVATAAGSASLTTNALAAGGASLTAEFVPADSAAFTGSTSAALAYTITAASAPRIPKLVLSKSSGLDPEGETVTVTGTGYNPAQPIYLTTCTDVPLESVSFAFISAGCTVGAKQITANPTTSTQVKFNEDGSFETTFLIAPKAGSTAVYTIANHTAQQDRSQDAKATVTFAAPAPKITASVTDASASGLSVSVVGTNFGSVTGAYAALIEKGTEAEVTAGGGFAVMEYWRPGTIVDGAFDKTLVAPAANLDADAQYEVIVWQQHSLPDSTTIYARGDVTFTAEQLAILFPGTTPGTTPETPVPPVDPFVPVAGGSLKWAISSSFSSYVTGPIAHGSIAVTNGATRAGGQFQFGQAAGSTYNAASGTGTVPYAGSVRYTGHNGALDVTIANPQVRISSSSTASLYVTSGGSQVNFATLNLAAATRTTSAGAVTYTAAPAALTAAGRDQVLGGFTTTLDPVTFTIGSAAAAPAGSTGTVAAAPAAATSSAVPSTPPATAGIEATPEQLDALSAGLPATVSASGFQTNEQDIKVVVYSTPIVLGTVNADAAGVATWTGSVPATLADGAHTLTFQGSVARGIPFTLARAAAATDGCVVAAASLRWGFKESFRSYIEGIAGGGWELTDVAYEYPEYVWTSGEGTADAETRTGLVTYGGSIRFTGHDGALDTTLANARVELTGDVGYLVFDITGTTQEGEAVTASGVRFAEFALPDLELTADGLVLDALPATLTAAGAEAFGTYPAGEALDPVSAVLPVSAECAAPAADEVEAVAAAPISEEAATAEPEAAPVWPWVLGGIAIALAIGAVIWVVARRRSVAAGADAGKDSDAE